MKTATFRDGSVLSVYAFPARLGRVTFHVIITASDGSIIYEDGSTMQGTPWGDVEENGLKTAACFLCAAAESYDYYHQDYARRNAVKYNYYRWACGRDRRLDTVWGQALARTARPWKAGKS